MGGYKIKRMNFFDGLFLTQEEFGTEQTYHKEMRRHHNAYFHGFGIVNGLEVSRYDNRKLKISPGVALTRERSTDEDITRVKGLEVVLSLDSDRVEIIDDNSIIVDLDAYEDIQGSNTVWVSIGIEEIEDNAVQSKGGDTPIHVWERPVIYCEADDPYENKDRETLSQQGDVDKIVLAKLNLTNGDIADSSDSIDLTCRINSGLDAKQIITDEIQVNSNAVINENMLVEGNLEVNNELSVKQAATFDQNLTVEGDLHVKGEFEKELMIRDDIITLNKSETDPPAGFTSGIEIDRGSYGLEAVLLWHEGDESGPNQEKRWKVGSDGKSGAFYDLAYGKDFKVDITTGNVGIGTKEPAEKLDVRGGRIRLKEETTNHEIAFRTDGDAVDIGWKGADLWISPINEDRNILLDPFNKGNIGIGSSTPFAKLSVNGGLHVGGDSDPGDNNLEVDGNANIGQTVTVGGNLEVSGTATFNDSVYVANFNNETLLLNKKSNLSSNFKAGIEIFRLATDNARLVWNEFSGRWQAEAGATEYNIVYGPGIDVDLASGNLGIGGVSTPISQKLEVAGNVKANGFIGDGSALTNLNGSQISHGTIPESVIPDSIARDSEVQASISGFSGHTHDGASSAKIPAINSNHFNNLNGSALTNLNASQLTSGTIHISRIPNTIARDAEVKAAIASALNHTHDGDKSPKIPGLTETHLDSVDGSQLTNLNAGSINGIISSDNLPPNFGVDPELENTVNDLDAEVTTARGSETNLNDRLSESLTADGQLKDDVVGLNQLDDSVSNLLIDVNRVHRVPLLQQTLYSRSRTVSTGKQPMGVVFDGTHIWTANHNEGRVSKIDIVSNRIVESVTSGAGPWGIAFDGANVWVANYDENTVSVIDVVSNTVVKTVKVDEEPAYLAFDGTSMWVTCHRSHTVNKINVTDYTVKKFSTANEPWGIVFDGRNIWVSHLGVKEVYKFFASTNTLLAKIAVPNIPYMLASDGKTIWVTHATKESISKINIKDHSVLTKTNIPNPHGVIFDGTHIWVTNISDNSVSKFDINKNKALVTVPVGGNPYNLSFDGNYLWSTNFESSSSSKIVKVI